VNSDSTSPTILIFLLTRDNDDWVNLTTILVEELKRGPSQFKALLSRMHRADYLCLNGLRDRLVESDYASHANAYSISPLKAADVIEKQLDFEYQRVSDELLYFLPAEARKAIPISDDQSIKEPPVPRSTEKNPAVRPPQSNREQIEAREQLESINRLKNAGEWPLPRRPRAKLNPSN
jgi:hypothetical protein